MTVAHQDPAGGLVAARFATEALVEPRPLGALMATPVPSERTRPGCCATCRSTLPRSSETPGGRGSAPWRRAVVDRARRTRPGPASTPRRCERRSRCLPARPPGPPPRRAGVGGRGIRRCLEGGPAAAGVGGVRRLVQNRAYTREKRLTILRAPGRNNRACSVAATVGPRRRTGQGAVLAAVRASTGRSLSRDRPRPRRLLLAKGGRDCPHRKGSLSTTPRSRAAGGIRRSLLRRAWCWSWPSEPW